MLLRRRRTSACLAHNSLLSADMCRRKSFPRRAEKRKSAELRYGAQDAKRSQRAAIARKEIS